MSLTKILDQLESKYYDELEEDRDKIVPELRKIHVVAKETGDDAMAQFRGEMLTRFGGMYIPYMFWEELATYIENNESRSVLFETIGAFTNSGFEEIERKRMKPLLLTYFSMEKEFELNKLFSVVVKKTHPSVQEYFDKLLRFVGKSSVSVTMYIEKFDVLKSLDPDFDLLKMPLIRLREHLAEKA